MIRPIAVLLSLIAAGVSSACAATANPPAPSTFPDMSSYTPVNPEDYKRETDNPGRPTKMVTYGFTTPDGIGCTFDQKPSASCTGNNLPAIPPAKCDPVRGPVEVNGISTDIGLRQYGGSTCKDGSPVNKVLHPFHTVTVYGVTCGVDDKRMTACKDPPGRGFVLSPSWSGWLPHV